MKLDNKSTTEILSDNNQFEDYNINIRKVIEKYTYHWKWFVFSATLAAVLAYFVLQRTSNEYEVSTSILIDDNESGGPAGLSAFQDLGLFGGSKNVLENEVGVLTSFSLMEKVVKDLKLTIEYYDPNKIANDELYNRNVPFIVNFLVHDSILHSLDTTFIISAKSKTHFSIEDVKGRYFKEAAFGENLTTTFGDINIKPKNAKNIKLGETIRIDVISLEAAVNSYRKRIEILQPESLQSTLLHIAITDPIKERAKDVLNKLILKYNEDANDYRGFITKNTDEFINQRIEEIYKELNVADRGIEDYKIENKLTDIGYEASLALESNSALEKQILELNAQIRLINYVDDYMKNNTTDLIPANLGLKDATTSQNTAFYNQLLMKRNKIIKSTTVRNPMIITLDAQISDLRISIKQSLTNLKTSLGFSLNEAQMQGSRLRSKRGLAPKQEREMKDIIRKQQTIETLYLYLLQKREENAIKMGATSPNAKIIDKAFGSRYPVSPSPKKHYAFAILTGLFIPFLIIFIYSFFDNKIHSLEDVETMIKAPILGDIPVSPAKEVKLVSDEDRGSVAEAFRMLRTNLNFMFTDDKEKSKIIFVTSTIAGEGKTFVSTNLASVLASMDKKVLLVGLDLRKPKMAKYLNVKSGVGLTNFLVDKDMKVPEIINSSENLNFDIIQSGFIPPNPADLLLNGRIDEVFDYGKENYDYIIVDTPPISMVTDTLLLSHYADMFVYVIRANYLDKRLLRTPKQLYENNRLPKMTVVINGADYKKAGYGYGYGYGYVDLEEKKSWRKKNKS